MNEYITQINDILDVIFSLGAFWVYAAIFLACFIENLFPPFPGDTFIVAAGALTAVDRLELLLVMLTIISGGVLSVMILYYFGKGKGHEYLHKKNFKLFPANDMIKSEKNFRRFGGLIILFSRFVVGFRSALAFVAGVSKYNSTKMLIYSVFSYLMFAGLLVYASIATVDNFDLLADYVKTYNQIVWPLLIILIVLYILRKIILMKRNS